MEKIQFTKIKNHGIFDDDFLTLTDKNGTIEFKRTAAAKGIAVVYAPNGTGKSSLSRVLQQTTDDKYITFEVKGDSGKTLGPASKSFHVIEDQLGRNIIRGKTNDYLIGSDIRKEYELRDKIDQIIEEQSAELIRLCKDKYMIKKVDDYLLRRIGEESDETHKKAYAYLRSFVNKQQRGKDIERNEFVEFIKSASRLSVGLIDDDKKLFVVEDLSAGAKGIIRQLIELDPAAIKPDQEIAYIEQYDDALHILNKYPDQPQCVVCGQPIDNAHLCQQKKLKKDEIYKRLDATTKTMLEKITGKTSLSVSDPFGIKRIVGDFITNGDATEFSALVSALDCCIRDIGNEIVNAMLDCFKRTDLVLLYDQLTKLIADKPLANSEELMYIEKVVSENIGKRITICRDETRDGSYTLKLGERDLLGSERSHLELSNGEQNFVSMTFELLFARNSEKEYIVIDDPISSFDSVFKNKLAFCFIKFLEKKKQIILTHNLDLVRLLEVQLNNCFNLYMLNNVEGGRNGFIAVSAEEKKILINLHSLIQLFRDQEHFLMNEVTDRRQFLMAMVPFMRGYAHICPNDNNNNKGNKDNKDDDTDDYGNLSKIMHGYTNDSLDVVKVYNRLFGTSLRGEEFISSQDILQIDCSDLHFMKKDKYPLLADTLEQTLIYYYLRMKVEKELTDLFEIPIKEGEPMMLTQIIQKAFGNKTKLPNVDERTSYRVFFVSRKTLLNEFNHFEGNMNIFQPAIDISKGELEKEVNDIENTLAELRRKIVGANV